MMGGPMPDLLSYAGVGSKGGDAIPSLDVFLRRFLKKIFEKCSTERSRCSVLAFSLFNISGRGV
jgi:hypothetical protein